MNWAFIGMIGGGILLVLCLLGKKRSGKLPVISDRTFGVVFAVLLLVFGFLLFYKIDEIPIPYHSDEAGAVYDALSLAGYHVDRWGYTYPVYLINFGGGQSALYAYLAMTAIKIFGYSVLTVRLPAVLCSLLSMCVFTGLIRREYGNTASLLAAGVFCLLPFSVMHSRWGLDAYLLFPLLIFSLAALHQAVRTGKISRFLCSGFLFGLTFYSYAISYILIPVYLGILSVYLLCIKKSGLKQLAALWIPMMLMAVPLILLLAVNNGMINEIRTPFFSVPKLFSYRGSEFSFRNILSNLKFGEDNIFYCIFARDGLIYNMIPEFGSMYYFTIPLLIFGFLLCTRDAAADLRKRKTSLNVMMVCLFGCIFFIQLLLPYNNVNRACGLYFPLIYFLVGGLIFMLKKKRAAAIVFCAVYVLCSLLFLRYYFTRFPEDLARELSITSVDDLKNALNFTEEVNPGQEPVTIYGLSQPYLYTLLVKEIDPYSFNEMREMAGENVISLGEYRFDPGEAAADQVYLIRTHGWIPTEIRDGAFSTADFGTITVYYP